MKNLILTLLFFLSYAGLAQPDSIVYSRDFEFKEGIYLTIDQFRSNRPIPQSAIISPIPKTELNFLTQVLEKKKVTYKDQNGVEQEIATAGIWGYCRNRSVYLNFNQTFNRLNVIGTLCHFTSEVVVLSTYQDPMYYNHGMSNSYNELRQFILCTDSNMVKDFNVASMQEILKNDKELYEQFMKLKKKDKSNSIFIYLRRYNEKYPLYITPFSLSSAYPGYPSQRRGE
jgi:hypothetical protein